MRVTPPKKHLSQSFLVDENIQQRIITACDLDPKDTVLEIGPGRGALTKYLSEKVHQTYAIETDASLCQELRDRFDPSHVTIIHADFLKYDLKTLPKGIKVIGNLPYHISTPIIEKLLANRHLFCDLFLTVQLEFGQRMAAKVNSKDYSALSCFVQYCCGVKVLFKIRNTSFRPVPKVTSCFMQLTPRKPADEVKREDYLFKVIQQIFRQRRKKIANALLPVMEKDKAQAILERLKIDESLRAENLTLKNYVSIVKILKEE